MRTTDLFQPLVEAREAPLYHWVGENKLPSILEEDRMGGYWEHILPLTNQKAYGNSFSRNPKFDYSIADKIARLTFDQDRLSRTNKIIPLDAEVVYDNTHGGAGMNNIIRDRDKLLKKKDPNAKSSEFYTDKDIMSEEFVIGDIKPLHRYLIEIHIYGAVDSDLRNLVLEYSKKYNIPVH